MSLDILNVGGNLCSTPHIVDTTRPASSKEHTVSMLDHTTFLDDVISLWSWAFYDCYGQKQEPCKKSVQTGNEVGDIQSDPKIWETLQCPPGK